jgi:hypothetical protein
MADYEHKIMKYVHYITKAHNAYERDLYQSKLDKWLNVARQQGGSKVLLKALQDKAAEAKAHLDGLKKSGKVDLTPINDHIREYNIKIDEASIRYNTEIGAANENIADIKTKYDEAVEYAKELAKLLNKLNKDVMNAKAGTAILSTEDLEGFTDLTSSAVVKTVVIEKIETIMATGDLKDAINDKNFINLIDGMDTAITTYNVVDDTIKTNIKDVVVNFLTNVTGSSGTANTIIFNDDVDNTQLQDKINKLNTAFILTNADEKIVATIDPRNTKQVTFTRGPPAAAKTGGPGGPATGPAAKTGTTGPATTGPATTGGPGGPATGPAAKTGTTGPATTGPATTGPATTGGPGGP